MTKDLKCERRSWVKNGRGREKRDQGKHSLLKAPGGLAFRVRLTWKNLPIELCPKLRQSGAFFHPFSL
jgi:hypothetical protein